MQRRIDLGRRKQYYALEDITVWFGGFVTRNALMHGEYTNVELLGNSAQTGYDLPVRLGQIHQVAMRNNLGNT